MTRTEQVKRHILPSRQLPPGEAEEVALTLYR